MFCLSHSCSNFRPSWSFSWLTALPCMAYSCIKFDFRTLPPEPDVQIETKVVGPGELKYMLVLITDKSTRVYNYMTLLSNCSEYCPNTYCICTKIQWYQTVIFTLKNLFAIQVGVQTQNCHTLPLSLIDLLLTAAAG